jgi:predicted O-methyltransferase YrrM
MKSKIDNSHCYSDIMGEIVKGCNFDTFLELGVDTGYTTKKILDKATNLKNVYCVDFRDSSIIKYESINKDKIEYFFNITTNNFFNLGVLKEVDCVFIDADHSYEQSRLDFLNAFNILSDDGIIFLHDTYPPSIELTSKDRNGDTYRLYLELSSPEWLDKIDIVNLPIYDGLTIIRKRISKKIFTL